MPNPVFQKLSQSLVQDLSVSLAQKATQSTLLPEGSKLQQALKAYKESPTGVYFRSVGNARKDCALLRFGRANNLSATLMTATDHRQSLYMPRYTSAMGFLISEPKDVISAHHTLHEKQLPRQTSQTITTRRQYIVEQLRLGHLQNRFDSRTGFGQSRQVSVNESMISLSKDSIAALVVHKVHFQGNQVQQLVNSHRVTNSELDALNQARLTAQLAYAREKLGDLPMLSFDGKAFQALDLSQDQWYELLDSTNQLFNKPALKDLLKSTNDDNYPLATGLQTSMAELKSLEQSYDIHELKHVAGVASSIPVDVSRYCLGLD